jgi:hypothetical protein
VFNVCPADNISFANGMLDMVTACCAFHHFFNPDAFMSNFSKLTNIKENKADNNVF